VELIPDSDKIKPAQPGDTPIGVISDTASLLGNNAEEQWTGIYERNEDGKIILESYTDTENKINYRPVLSKSYDTNKKYIPRSQRTEWNIVGLVGRVKILKGAVTAPTWRKLNKFNDKYDIWLIR